MTENRNDAAVMEKIMLTGELKLLSPLRIGSAETGDSGNGARTVDTYVMKGKSGKPCIPGSSLTGVLRSLTREYSAEIADVIFGSAHDAREVTTLVQSAIDVSDVILNDAKIIYRDGVAIDDMTGTAITGAKFDYEAVERGAHGTMELTFTLRETHRKKRSAIHAAIDEIARRLVTGVRIGALTTKGFGLVSCDTVKKCAYDFTDAEAVKAYLLHVPYNSVMITQYDGGACYGGEGNDLVIDARFALATPIIVRHEPSDDEKDMAHVMLRAEDESGDFVIPGTSMKGVLRHQARRILRALGKGVVSDKFIERLMGSSSGSSNDDKIKSRLIVDETYIKAANATSYKQTRIKIDRFTSGTISGSLFEEKPIFQNDASHGSFKLHFTVKNATEAEAGLMVYLLRDLWLGRVAVGGEKSIGRGLLRGLSATIYYTDDRGARTTYEMAENGSISGDERHEKARRLERCAESLRNMEAD